MAPGALSKTMLNTADGARIFSRKRNPARMQNGSEMLPPRRIVINAQDFYNDTLAALAIEFRVKNTLPGAQIQSAVGHR